MNKVMMGGDIVSTISKEANKIEINLKNWHLPKYKYTGILIDVDTRLYENGNSKSGWAST